MIYCIPLASILWIWSAVIYEIYDNPIIRTLKNSAIENVSIDIYIWNVCGWDVEISSLLSILKKLRKIVNC